MKEIRAYIQPFMLSKLTQALMEIEDFPGMSVSDCEGFGREIVLAEQEYSPFIAKKRIEIISPDNMVDTIYQVILSTANTHSPGAGNIYISDIERGTRISTGETGTDQF
jgi:nitrogen regulatory protein P-II 1